MFEKKSLVFYYCTTPLHMGAGTSVGAIDNPIQREVHSNHPIIAGSGLKGAVRHHVTRQWGSERKNNITALFGSETTSGDLTAGAVSFTDANLIAFPVRSVKNTYVYVTCPYALARLKRMAELAGLDFKFDVAGIKTVSASTDSALIEGKLCLEAYEFNASEDEDTTGIAEWLSENCLSDDGGSFFKEKIQSDLFVLTDDDFNFFIKQATVVEAHVRIDDETGTAVRGALFYTENLPPESILAGVVLSSTERKAKDNRMSAEQCLEKTMWDEDGVSGQLVQMGGDATTGRGLVLINAMKGV